MVTKIELGFEGEKLVSLYLEQRGFKILTKNYRTKMGEIDIIAFKQSVIAFVEVKLRINPKFYISELITYSKQKKIIKTALHYISSQLKQLNLGSELIYRFDVALVELAYSESPEYKITYIENAFSL